jgi:hypothetical protein
MQPGSELKEAWSAKLLLDAARPWRLSCNFVIATFDETQCPLRSQTSKREKVSRHD